MANSWTWVQEYLFQTCSKVLNVKKVTAHHSLKAGYLEVGSWVDCTPVQPGAHICRRLQRTGQRQANCSFPPKRRASRSVMLGDVRGTTQAWCSPGLQVSKEVLMWPTSRVPAGKGLLEGSLAWASRLLMRCCSSHLLTSWTLPTQSPCPDFSFWTSGSVSHLRVSRWPFYQMRDCYVTRWPTAQLRVWPLVTCQPILH